VNKTRALIVAAVVVVFVVAGGVLIYANQSRGGQAVTINLNVTGGTSMAPESPTAHQNDKVTINMTSDTDGEVHLHGYDIRSRSRPARPCRAPSPRTRPETS